MTNSRSVKLLAVSLVCLTLGPLTLDAAAAAANASRKLAVAINSMAFDLYRSMETDHSNILFSPVSISSAMSMLLLGAQGSTQDELYRGLRFHDSQSFGGHRSALSAQAHMAFEALLRQPPADSPAGLSVDIANRVLVRQGQSILPTYRRMLADYYHADVGEADFRDQAAAVQSINSWVSNRTHGNIRALFSSLEPDLKLVLLNAVYFKGQWRDQFRTRYNAPGTFHGLTQNYRNILFMRKSAELPYMFNRERNFQLLELPYKGDYGFLMLLPDKETDLNTVTKELGVGEFEDSVRRLRPVEVDLKMPKFRIQDSHNLKSTLAPLNIRTVFGESADLSGITGDHSLRVSAAIHKAVIVVDEQGTEASAATGIRVVPRSGAPRISFLADRPFLYFIRNQKTGIVYFMGRVVRF